MWKNAVRGRPTVVALRFPAAWRVCPAFRLSISAVGLRLPDGHRQGHGAASKGPVASAAAGSSAAASGAPSAAPARPLRELTEFLYPERHRLAGGVVLLVGSTSISLLFPHVMGDVLDSCMRGEAGPGGAVYSPASAAAALFGLSLLQAASDIHRP